MTIESLAESFLEAKAKATMPSIDRLKDAKADETRLATGTASRRSIVEESGKDFEKMEREIASDSVTPGHPGRKLHRLSLGFINSSATRGTKRKRIFLISIILSTNISFARPFKPGRLKEMPTDPPLKCALFEGLWEGECNEDGRTYPARLQVYQDGCTELALFDFDNPVPIHYKVGRHSTSGNMFTAAPFYNDTNYSEWIDSFQTLSAKGFFSTQIFSSGKNVIYSGDYTFKAGIRNGELWTDDTSNVTSPDRPGTIYQSHCEYKKQR